MARERRQFSEEFKREAVRLAYESGRRLSDVARELDVGTNLIRRGLAGGFFSRVRLQGLFRYYRAS